ncbi:hypothetical protein E1091_01585 [Micromonospora fluostatini]|uniref:DUF1273 family protein n=1 Tax=Micromonospora fluostatini TaxID=1629071 RepID=A0ABY2DLS9_9ACTN|nr:hypothetical protein E1091_01585 [Micromonospora fluostatini]
MNAPIWPVVAGIGHPDMPRRLTMQGRLRLRRTLNRVLTRLRDEHGATVGVSGMDAGFGLLFAEAVLDVGLQLRAYRPGPWQADNWAPAQKIRWRELCERAAQVEDLSLFHSEGAYRQRDEALVDVADVCVAWWDTDERHGAVYHAVKHAVQHRRRPVIRVDPTVIGDADDAWLPSERTWYRYLGLDRELVAPAR